MGGFIAQVIAQKEPQLVRKIILTGTGPAGGEGIDRVTSVSIRDTIKAVLTFKDPKYYLFFTKTANGRLEARKFLKRLKERTDHRDKAISVASFRAHLKAIDIVTLPRFGRVGEEKCGTFSRGGNHGQTATTLYQRIQAKGS
jgi:pimeloyl-ACP methyl ester carboxylesterase